MSWDHGISIKQVVNWDHNNTSIVNYVMGILGANVMDKAVNVTSDVKKGVAL